LYIIKIHRLSNLEDFIIIIFKKSF